MPTRGYRGNPYIRRSRKTAPVETGMITRTIKIQDGDGGINFIRTSASDETVSTVSKLIKDANISIGFGRLCSKLRQSLMSMGYEFEMVTLQSTVNI